MKQQNALLQPVKLIAMFLLMSGVVGCSVINRPDPCPDWVQVIQPSCTDHVMSDFLFLQIDNHNLSVVAACRERVMPTCIEVE